jgi:hypothetical protein
LLRTVARNEADLVAAVQQTIRKGSWHQRADVGQCYADRNPVQAGNQPSEAQPRLSWRNSAWFQMRDFIPLL